MNTNAFKQLAQAFATSQTPSEIEGMLKALLTPKEVQDLGNRLDIVRLLREGKTQREVSTELRVGIATVTRGAKALNAGVFDELLNTLGANYDSK
jgi:TrpR family transcriptional regulator, trp operon repressor